MDDGSTFSLGGRGAIFGRIFILYLIIFAAAVGVAACVEVVEVAASVDVDVFGVGVVQGIGVRIAHGGVAGFGAADVGAGLLNTMGYLFYFYCVVYIFKCLQTSQNKPKFLLNNSKHSHKFET